MMRNERGQFKLGHTGNAGGRPKDEHRVAESEEAKENLENFSSNKIFKSPKSNLVWSSCRGLNGFSDYVNQQF